MFKDRLRNFSLYISMRLVYLRQFTPKFNVNFSQSFPLFWFIVLFLPSFPAESNYLITGSDVELLAGGEKGFIYRKSGNILIYDLDQNREFHYGHWGPGKFVAKYSPDRSNLAISYRSLQDSKYRIRILNTKNYKLAQKSSIFSFLADIYWVNNCTLAVFSTEKVPPRIYELEIKKENCQDSIKEWKYLVSIPGHGTWKIHSDYEKEKLPWKSATYNINTNISRREIYGNFSSGEAFRLSYNSKKPTLLPYFFGPQAHPLGYVGFSSDQEILLWQRSGKVTKVADGKLIFLVKDDVFFIQDNIGIKLV